MATPFIDILTDAQKVTVAQKSRGAKRPSYYDGTRAETQARLANTGNEEGTEGALVQISEDLEATLILMSTKDKTNLLTFVASAIKVASDMSTDDFVLMAEVVAVRKAGYVQVWTDVGQKTSSYDVVRASILNFIEQTANQNVVTTATGSLTQREDPTSVVIPDLGALFSSLSDSYRVLAAPDILAVHDRISDTGTLYAYQNAASHRTRELSSWVAIITLYLI
jgi:hypothetical protein